MKASLIAQIVSLAALLGVTSTLPAQPNIAIPMDAAHWNLHDWGRWPANAEKSQFTDHLGRPSLYVGSGLASLPDLKLQDGIIEADVAPHPRGAFFGLAFRIRSAEQFELIYFRPAASGTIDAVQYTPVLNGAIAWQIFHGPEAQASAEIPTDRWMHLRLEVAGIQASLFLDREAKPALMIPDIRQGDSIGSIGFWGLFGGGYLSNLTYEPRPERPAMKAARPEFAPGTLSDWAISDAFDVGEIDPMTYPEVAKLNWQHVEAEVPGMVVLNRYRHSPEIMPTPPREKLLGTVAGSKVVFAKATIQSSSARSQSMWLGYSDEAVVFLNGKPLFNGKNEWRFRDGGASLGLLDLNDRIVLPLKAGGNELVIAVTEFMGGWGFECRLEDSRSTKNESKPEEKK